ncbi:zinc ribbon domain-containing protein [Microbispora amethystogenes]|uniref:zinc ribbon domain-containing protein n=1 Tax=Microbispora amethystogenes TaxID=1427754 RepID=UPI0027DAB695|nr:zinc ribbon domain-containing protein [Microbispora amethystogenes]
MELPPARDVHLLQGPAFRGTGGVREPRHTSQRCSACGHIAKKNRPDQATFTCTSCGFAEHADVNAARNIAARGVAGWAVSHAADDAA